MRQAGERGGHALDVPVSALAGLATAFAAFVAPADLLGDLVAASGLPSLIPSAQPPLGFTARLAVGAGGALLAFGLALALLRWLGRFGRRGDDALELVDEAEPPRVRRRDFHPDAPPRPPILAVADLGEPMPQPQAEAPPEPEPEPEPAEEQAFEPEPEPRRHAWLPEPPPAPIPPEPVPEPEPEPVPAPSFGTSIPELMERLERGLALRRSPPSAPPAAPPAPTPAPPAPQSAAPFQDLGDERLQSAIDSLQRLAARQL